MSDNHIDQMLKIYHNAITYYISIYYDGDHTCKHSLMAYKDKCAKMQLYLEAIFEKIPDHVKNIYNLPDPRQPMTFWQ